MWAVLICTVAQVKSSSSTSSLASIRFLALSRRVVFHGSKRVILSNSAIASVNLSASPSSNPSMRSWKEESFHVCVSGLLRLTKTYVQGDDK